MPATNGKSPHELMEEVLEATGKQRFVSDALNHQDRIRQIEELLPEFMKGQAARLVKRALVTFARKVEDYRDIYVPSFVRAVLEAAELGLAIDGRLAHAVVFSNKVKGKGGAKDEWRREVQLMVDYKGIIAIAKRNVAIEDCFATLIYSKDKFRMWEADGRQHYEINPSPIDRGDLLGCLAVILFPGGRMRREFMNNPEIDAIRSRSKSWTSEKGPSGPWKTDDGEMRKKTVIRRILKLYVDDPGVARLLELDNDIKEEFAHVATPPEFLDLASAVENRLEESRQKRASKRQPSEFTAADQEETKPAAEETKPAEKETKPAKTETKAADKETEPPHEDMDQDGDAYEGEMPLLAEDAKTEPKKETKPEKTKTAKPPVDDGVV